MSSTAGLLATNNSNTTLHTAPLQVSASNTTFALIARSTGGESCNQIPPCWAAHHADMPTKCKWVGVQQDVTDKNQKEGTTKNQCQGDIYLHLRQQQI